MKQKFQIIMVLFVICTIPVLAQSQSERWKKRLDNMMLSNVEAGATSNGSAAGRSGDTQAGMTGIGDLSNLGSSSGSSVSKLHLCTDKSFVLTIDDSANVAGISAASSAKIVGTWAIGNATQVDAKITLTPRNKSDVPTIKTIKLQNFTVSFTGDRTFVNQSRWYRMQSSVCKK
jgi:hypothetical protein